MVEDEEESEKVCMTCSKYKVGTKICGIFKPYRDFMKLHGKNDIESEFSCSIFSHEK